jgi:hypothetical protein
MPGMLPLAVTPRGQNLATIPLEAAQAYRANDYNLTTKDRTLRLIILGPSIDRSLDWNRRIAILVIRLRPLGRADHICFSALPSKREQRRLSLFPAILE